MADFTRARQVCKGSAARWTRKLYHEPMLSSSRGINHKHQQDDHHRGQAIRDLNASLVTARGALSKADNSANRAELRMSIDEPLDQKSPALAARRKRKNYSEGDGLVAMKGAMEAVSKGSSCTSAAKLFGVSERSLRSRTTATAPLPADAHPGRKTAFTREAEAGIKQYLIDCFQRGCGLRIRDLRRSARFAAASCRVRKFKASTGW